uniref:SPOR domain-containing protein n=1 Tax=Gelidibacter sp. TaxID=2018083 RepID=UPI00404B3C57
MKQIFIFLFLLVSQCPFGQEGLPFGVNQQLYLKGQSALIGNHILSTDAKKPFNEPNVINDVLKLEYIDVDSDSNTFCSSEANLTIAKSGSSIKYAALYWSAVYKYDKGIRKELNGQLVYRGDDKRSEDVNSVLFKMPQGSYLPITGKIVFDSFQTKLFEDSKPYVCYADVTNYLQNSTAVDGTYTVANIKATEGFVSGGAAGGWLLYVVYEDENVQPRYFTTYNGFVEVDKKPVDIAFKDFKTNEVGTIETSLLLAALEGDQKYKTDVCSIFNTKTNAFQPLKTKHRPEKNFFNSTITFDDEMYMDRNPNSTNTLGFDLMKLKIPNTDNAIISNNSSETTIQFTTKADRFYLFFVAFETEISPIYLEGKTDEESILVLNETDTREEETIEVVETIPVEVKEDIVKPVSKPKSNLEKITGLKSIKIPDVPKGYYLVTNVYSVEENAKKWLAFLKDKGHDAKSYINPKNGWHYIYLKNDEDPNAIIAKRKELSKLDYFKDIWILKINF